MGWGQTTGIVALTQLKGKLRQQLAELENDHKTASRDVGRLEHQRDKVAELKAARLTARDAEQKLNAKKRENEANDRKLADAIRERDRVAKELDSKTMDLKRLADEMRSAAHNRKFGQVKGLGNKAVSMANDLERLEGKLRGLA